MLTTASPEVNKPPGETNFPRTPTFNRAQGRMTRATLEGTGLLRPLEGGIGTLIGPTKRLPMRSCSHSGVTTSTRRAAANGVGNLAKTLSSMGKNCTISNANESSVSLGSINLNSAGNERRTRLSKKHSKSPPRSDPDASSTSVTSATTWTSSMNTSGSSSRSRYKRSSSLDLRPASEGTIPSMDESSSTLNSTKFQRSSSMDLRPNTTTTTMDASASTWAPSMANTSISTGLDASAATWACAPSRVPRSFRRTMNSAAAAAAAAASKPSTASAIKIFGPAVTTPGLKRSNPTTIAINNNNNGPAIRRTKSSNLDEMRASIRLGDPYGIQAKLEQQFLGRRSNSTPLDDLESVASEPTEENPEQTKAIEIKTATTTTNNKSQNKFPPTRVLQRALSDPLEASSSHTTDDFFRQFDIPSAFGDDDGFAFAPDLRRNHSAPMPDFGDFPDTFHLGETDWNPTPVLSREEQPVLAQTDEDEEVANVLVALANAKRLKGGVRRVSSTPKKVLAAASQKARATLQEKRDAASSSLFAAAHRSRSHTPERGEIETLAATKNKLLTAAERAKARVKERKEIQATTTVARKTLLSSSQRAKTRVQVRKAAEGNKLRLRSKSPLRKTKSAGSNYRRDNASLADLEDDRTCVTKDSVETKDFTRNRGSAASWHELVCADIDEDGGSVMTNQSNNVRGIGGIGSSNSPRGFRSRSPRRLRRLNSNPRVASSRTMEDEESLEDKNNTFNAPAQDRKKAAEEEAGATHEDEHQLGDFLSAKTNEAKGKIASVGVSDHTVGGESAAKGKVKTTSPMRGVQTTVDGDAKGEIKPGEKARRTSLQGIQDLARPQKSAKGKDDVTEDLPRLQKLGENNKDDSTAGETSSRSETKDRKSHGRRHSSDGHSRRRRSSTKSESGAKVTCDSDKHKKSRRRSSSKSTDGAPHEKVSRRSSTGSAHSTSREKDSRRKSADRMKAHNSLADIAKKSTEVPSEERHHHDSRRRRSKDSKARRSSSENRKHSKSTDGKNRRLKAHINRDDGIDESEKSIGLSDLELGESTHGSSSTYTHGSSTNGSMNSSSRTDRGRSKSSSSSSRLGDSKSHDLNRSNENERKPTVKAPGAPERPSLCQSLQLDTVPETYNEDEQSESAPRDPSKRKGRSPSANSSIQSTAELSHSEDEFADDALRISGKRNSRPHGRFAVNGSAPGGMGIFGAAGDLERRWREFAHLEMRHSSDGAMYYQGANGDHGQDPHHRWPGHHPMMHSVYPHGPHPYADGRHLPHDGHSTGVRNWPSGLNAYYGPPMPPMGSGWMGPRMVPGPAHGAYRGGQLYYSLHAGMVHPPVAQEQGASVRRVSANDRSSRGSLRRRHSIGSGHGRDAIMHEVTVAMERELRTPTCFRCGESLGQCHCAEPVVDISRHSRSSDSLHGTTADAETNTVKFGEQYGSVKAPRRSSLRDTFGIGLGETPTSEPMAVKPVKGTMSSHDGTMDFDLHVGNPNYYYYGPPRPLYDRPAAWDVHDYVNMSSAGGRLAGSRNLNVHRGRPLGGVARKDNNSNRGHRGTRSVAVDDDSIRYPGRTVFEGSKSGRSMFSADEGSGRSFFS